MSRDDDSKRLSDLIDSVADGRSVDWDAAGAAPNDDRMRRLFEMLRIVDGIADVHRSEIASGEQAPTRTAGGTSDSTIDPEFPLTDSRFDRWGHFELLRKLGEGSFGEVYHARDAWLDHSVALKLLKPIVDRKRFLHEARTLAQIRHPNVVAIHGADEHGGRLGFWMDLIEGPTLADVVKHEGVRSPAEAALIGRDLCRAMAAVHATGIVHRDIKAQNVIRQSKTGHIILMDFGAGEAMDADRAGRRPTGTPLYLAPELFDGSVATKETDIYALGVLLFHLVTRSYPMYGNTMSDLQVAHHRGVRHHLGDMRPDLPDDFVRVVETMIAPDPAKRFHSATEARKALEEVVAPHDIHVVTDRQRHVSWWERIYAWSGRVGVVVVGATTVGFASTVAFNLTFGRGEFGSESPLQWFVWGLRALVGPLRSVFLYTIAAMIIAAAAKVIRRLVPPLDRAVSTLTIRCRSFVKDRQLDDPNLLLQVTAGLGALAFALVALYRWDDAMVFAMYIDNAPPQRLAMLQPANESHFDFYSRLLEVVLFTYGLTADAVYKSVRRSGVRIPSATTTYVLMVPFMALVVMRGVPYRVVYQNAFERVDYGDMRCYDLGRRDGKVRLFCPDEPPPRITDKDLADSKLHSRSIRESVFTRREDARVFATASP